MAKAFRTDVVEKKKFPDEIRQLQLATTPERVNCPVDDCTCTYEMYGHTPLNRDANIVTLQERVKREHPSHTSEVLAVNQFRRGRR